MAHQQEGVHEVIVAPLPTSHMGCSRHGTKDWRSHGCVSVIVWRVSSGSRCAGRDMAGTCPVAQHHSGQDRPCGAGSWASGRGLHGYCHVTMNRRVDPVVQLAVQIVVQRL